MITCVAVLLGQCVVNAQLTNGGVYSTELPTTATSYDGVERDISRFYTPDNLQFHVSGNIDLASNTRIKLSYDNGLETDKLERDPTLNVGIQQFIEITENSVLALSAGVELGGDVEHTSCKDSYGREYYCGNLTAWSDFKQPKNETDWNVGASYHAKFTVTGLVDGIADVIRNRGSYGF